MELPDFGNLELLDILDVLDVLIVGYLLYRVYRLLRGTIAFNIFIGLIILYGTWLLVRYLDMRLLTFMLDQFVSVGVIVLIILFQPELRKFLLLIGNTTMKTRSNFLSRILISEREASEIKMKSINEITKAVLELSRKKIGALIVIGDGAQSEVYAGSGVPIDSNISKELLISIFSKESPLHDGAVVIHDGKIKAASCILPVSESRTLPTSVGLRHRAGVGVSENTNQIALVVSEETGDLSMAFNGSLRPLVSESELQEKLIEHYE